MQPVVAGSLCTGWPSTTSTMTEDAPHVHSPSDRCAGAEATVASINKHTRKNAAVHRTSLERNMA